jgi:hypothetical protein
MAKRKLELNVSADSIVAIGVDGTHYLWTHGADEWQAKADARETYEKANAGVNVVSLMDANADYDTDHAFVFYVADCMSPPLYLVFGKSMEDAYETFITEFERLIKIEEADLKDYNADDITYNDNGTAVDDEAVQFIGVREIIVRDSAKAST